MSNAIESKKTKRDLSIDRFRGALVITMVIGDFIAGVNWIPSFLKHAPDIGFTVADTVAPAFVFVIGLNFGPSFEKRFALGRFAAYRHFALRYLILLAIGSLITAGANLVDRSTGWGVLESLGVAGLVALALIRLPTWSRFAIGLLILGLYQFALDNWMLDSVINSGHGGPFGSISWSALLLLATAVADVWRKGFTPYVVCVTGVAAIAVITALIVPVSKNRVSMSFVLLSLAISALTFLLIKRLEQLSSQKRGLLCWWGERSLTLYLLHLLLLSLFGLPSIDWWYADASPWLMFAQLIALVGLMSVIARWLSLRQKKTT